MPNSYSKKKTVIKSTLTVVLVLFLTGCIQRELTFTFNNKTSYTIDSIQVEIISQQGCLQSSWQLERIRKLLPYSTAKLTLIPDQTCDGGVTVTVFKDSLERVIYGGYFSNGSFPRDRFGNDKLKYSIVESDTGIIRIVNDSNERIAMNGSYSDFSFSLSINTNANTGAYYFDNMRFGN